jgi:ribosomal-protein-alanine N-acetyltransferase
MDLLETERLILRELRATDADRIYRYANDDAINRYLIFADLASEDDARKYVQKAVASAALATTGKGEDRRLSFKLAILLKPEGDFIGSCWLDITDATHRRASIGYFFDNLYWGNGYATEAVQALLAYGFATLKLHRIEASCDAEHQATRRVLEKAGLRREARLRQNRLRKNLQGQSNWTDSCLYAIIEDEAKDA